jgi:hypothetical protein
LLPGKQNSTAQGREINDLSREAFKTLGNFEEIDGFYA